MSERLRITSIRFRNYKAFRDYSISLNPFNVLVGPNNAGKSTVPGAIRILSEGIRRARAGNLELIYDNYDLQILTARHLPLVTSHSFSLHGYSLSHVPKFVNVPKPNNKHGFFVCDINKSLIKKIESQSYR